ncbi:MAG: VWA domain-containing protein, partial [Myxococcales bacterium]|nr:VWA domain-containing protein [Myxococcales bacterium]
MPSFEHFHFLRPWWLMLIPCAIVLGWWRYRKNIPASNWAAVVDAHLLSHLLKNGGKTLAKQMYWLPIFLTLLALALAGPTLERVKNFSNLVGRPLIVVLELSHHMLSTDISPNRLKRALFKLRDILAQEKEHEVSLIAFAGDAHVVTPLTTDHYTILTLSDELSPDIMPIKGTRLLSALKEAASMSRTGADILVMTSTNVEEQPSTLLKYIDANKLRVIIWGFATKAGAPVMDVDGRFHSKSGGMVNISSLNQDWLKAMEANSRVSVVPFSDDGSDEKKVMSLLSTEVQESM